MDAAFRLTVTPAQAGVHAAAETKRQLGFQLPLE